MDKNSHYREKDQTAKMLYWLIPYLVVYNASDSGEWKYGPEHVFKVEVRINATTENSDELHSNVNAQISCRPMNSSLVQCRVETAAIDNFKISSNASDQTRTNNYINFEIGNIAFQIEFNDVGVSKILHLNTRGSYQQNIIRAIVDNLNVGLDLRDRKFGNYVSVDKSVNGICDTSFDLRKLNDLEDKRTSLIEDYEFNVVAFSKKLENQSMVIVKNRLMDNCVEKTPYFFGKEDELFASNTSDAEREIDVKSSRSKIYLGPHSFSSYTENTATVITTIPTPNENDGKSIWRHKISESIRLSLELIRPARRELS